MHGFTVRTHRDETDKTGLGETNSMLLDRCNVKVLGLRVEEGHGRGINAMAKRSRGHIAVSRIVRGSIMYG